MLVLGRVIIRKNSAAHVGIGLSTQPFSQYDSGCNFRQPPGMYKALVYSGISYQPQLVFTPDFWTINSTIPPTIMVQWKNVDQFCNIYCSYLFKYSSQYPLNHDHGRITMNKGSLKGDIPNKYPLIIRVHMGLIMKGPGTRYHPLPTMTSFPKKTSRRWLTGMTCQATSSKLREVLRSDTIGVLGVDAMGRAPTTWIPFGDGEATSPQVYRVLI